MERSQRSYFLLLALAAAVGWSSGLWAVPLAAFVVLELAWTAAENLARRELREVEVERVQ